MNKRSDGVELLEQLRVPCAGSVWGLNLHEDLPRDQVFPGGQGLPAPPRLVGPHVHRLGREVHGARRRRSLQWVWLSPSVDPFSSLAPGWDGVALETARMLMEAGYGVTVRTRAGVPHGRQLVQLSGTHPGMLRVELVFFSGDITVAAPWEAGADTIDDRLALAEALLESGADVTARLGPIVPMINDDERMVTRLGRALMRRGIKTMTPFWIEGGQGLVRRIERQVSRSRARMVHGWLHLEGSMAGRGPRSVPDRVRRPILRTLRSACDSAGINLLTCACNAPGGLEICLTGPPVQRRDRQISLFAEGA